MPLVPLPLDPVVDIVVNLAARAAVRKSFDLCLLIGDTDLITPADRVAIYASLEEMAGAGFETTDRLYQAASLVFGQNKSPNRVAIGCIGTVTEDDSTTRAETPLEAFTACREANEEWYVGIYCNDAVVTDHIAIAQYTQSARPSTLYAYTTSDAGVVTNEDDNIFARMKSLSYRRAIGQYSTKHVDAIAAIVGYAMGSMTGTVNSAFTLAYKTEVGVQTENATSVFTSQSVENIKANNGNVFINRGTYYNVFEAGTMADGTWFDEMIYLDKFVNDCQLTVMDVLYTRPKLPQTEAGMTIIHTVINEVCEVYANIGFIAPGVWKSIDILDLIYGTTLPNGYLVQSEPIDTQLQADRDARKAPNVYIALKLAGAIHHVLIQVDVNR